MTSASPISVDTDSPHPIPNQAQAQEQEPSVSLLDVVTAGLERGMQDNAEVSDDEKKRLLAELTTAIAKTAALRGIDLGATTARTGATLLPIDEAVLELCAAKEWSAPGRGNETVYDAFQRLVEISESVATTLCVRDPGSRELVQKMINSLNAFTKAVALNGMAHKFVGVEEDATPTHDHKSSQPAQPGKAQRRPRQRKLLPSVKNLTQNVPGPVQRCQPPGYPYPPPRVVHHQIQLPLDILRHSQYQPAAGADIPSSVQLSVAAPGEATALTQLASVAASMSRLPPPAQGVPVAVSLSTPAPCPACTSGQAPAQATTPGTAPSSNPVQTAPGSAPVSATAEHAALMHLAMAAASMPRLPTPTQGAVPPATSTPVPAPFLSAGQQVPTQTLPVQLKFRNKPIETAAEFDAAAARMGLSADTGPLVRVEQNPLTLAQAADFYGLISRIVSVQPEGTDPYVAIDRGFWHAQMTAPYARATGGHPAAQYGLGRLRGCARAGEMWRVMEMREQQQQQQQQQRFAGGRFVGGNGNGNGNGGGQQPPSGLVGGQQQAQQHQHGQGQQQDPTRVAHQGHAQQQFQGPPVNRVNKPNSSKVSLRHRRRANLRVRSGRGQQQAE